MKLVVVIQARMGSTRLPGKVLMPLAGRPLLERMLERVRAAESEFEIVVATTTDAADQPLRELGKRLGVAVFSGHPSDLLDRHLQAAEALGADAVAKIPSDCPAIDPRVIDRVIGEYAAHRAQCDLVTNLHPPTWPDGNDVEVMSISALRTAWREATRPHEREHTTPFIWDRPGRFRIRNVAYGRGNFSASHRLTIDYPEDHALLDRVFGALHGDGEPFSVEEVMAFLDAHPELARLNAVHRGTSWHLGCLESLRTVAADNGALVWR